MNTVAIERETLHALSTLIERRMGLFFPAERHDALSRGLERAGAELGFNDPAAYASHLLATGISREEQDILAHALTTGETYFFREPPALKALEEHVLPELINARRQSGEKRLRLWSAGCCTGEEAYTLAIMLARLIPSLSEWDITILATDINPAFLRKARAGRYREWSFRGVPHWLKRDYFSTCARDEYEVLSHVRQMVTFSYLNLIDDVYPSLVNNTSAMDLILCRNVTMYFSPGRAELVTGKFHQALLNGGWLVMSPSEVSTGSARLFSRVAFDGATLHRKEKAKAAAPRRPFPGIPMPSYTPDCAPLPDALPLTVPDVLSDVVYEATCASGEEDGKPPPATPSAIAAEAYAQARYETVLGIAEELPEPPVDVLVLAARSCADLGRLDDALAWCSTALELDKLQVSVHHLMATILMAKHDEPAAHAALKRVLYLDPHSTMAHFMTANLLLQTGDHAAATKEFRKTLTLLAALDDDGVVPDSDGMTAERLKVIVGHVQESLASRGERAS